MATTIPVQPFARYERMDQFARRPMELPACISPMDVQVNSTSLASDSESTDSSPSLESSESLRSTPSHQRSQASWLMDDLSFRSDLQRVENEGVEARSWTSESAKKRKVGIRKIPRSSQHAKELARNRTAASKYRQRQKTHMDSLLQRAKREEKLAISQRQVVDALREELHHLRQMFLIMAGKQSPSGLQH